MRSSVIAISLAFALTAGAAYAAGSFTLQPQDSVQVIANQCNLTVIRSDDLAVNVACGPKWTPIPVPTSPPPGQPPAGAVHEGVPICTDHVATKWHPLVKRDGNGAIVCTYGHEHHDDPNAVNDIFGPPGAWAGIAGQEISYPWQTFSAAGKENEVKHEGYKVYTARDHPCVLPSGSDPALTGCFRAWRMQTHAMGHASDATTRFHSFSFEALVQYPDGSQGIIRHGGWIDGGHLALNVSGGGGAPICPPMPSNPETFTCGSGVRRAHSSANVPAPNQPHNSYFANWYATHQHTQIAPHLEEWGPVDYQNPTHQLYHDPSRQANNSRGRPELMSVNVRHSFFRPFTDAQSRLTITTYTDRLGFPYAPTGATLTGGSGTLATSPSACPANDPANCVPLVIEGVRAGEYGWSANDPRTGPLVDRDHDVMSPVTGNSLIRFPN